MAWVATAVVGSAVIGAGASLYGSSKAADAQTAAADKASQTSMNMFNTTNTNLQPYREIGAYAKDRLMENLPDLISPINLTQDWLESTPGYQFNKTQGLKATQNSAAARGLGVSGAALKGTATFATGLADNTYKTQFDVANINKTNAYNRLKGLVDTGQNASAQTGAAGTAAANTSAAAQIGAGNAQAAGYNAAGAAVGNLANNIGGYAAYKGLYGGGSTGYTGGGSNAPGDASNWTGYNVTGL